MCYILKHLKDKKLCSLRIGTKEHTKFLHCVQALLEQYSQVPFFFLTRFLTHFLFYTNLRVWVFKCKLQIRVGGWGTGLIQ